jgi:hypothetical protein
MFYKSPPFLRVVYKSTVGTRLKRWAIGIQSIATEFIENRLPRGGLDPFILEFWF